MRWLSASTARPARYWAIGPPQKVLQHIRRVFGLTLEFRMSFVSKTFLFKTCFRPLQVAGLVEGDQRRKSLGSRERIEERAVDEEPMKLPRLTDATPPVWERPGRGSLTRTCNVQRHTIGGLY